MVSILVEDGEQGAKRLTHTSSIYIYDAYFDGNVFPVIVGLHGTKMKVTFRFGDCKLFL